MRLDNGIERHDTQFVQTRLTIKQNNVIVDQMSLYYVAILFFFGQINSLVNKISRKWLVFFEVLLILWQFVVGCQILKIFHVSATLQQKIGAWMLIWPV